MTKNRTQKTAFKRLMATKMHWNSNSLSPLRSEAKFADLDQTGKIDWSQSLDHSWLKILYWVCRVTYFASLREAAIFSTQPGPSTARLINESATEQTTLTSDANGLLSSKGIWMRPSGLLPSWRTKPILSLWQLQWTPDESSSNEIVQCVMSGPKRSGQPSSQWPICRQGCADCERRLASSSAKGADCNSDCLSVETFRRRRSGFTSAGRCLYARIWQ